MVHEDVQRVRHRHLTLSDQMSKSAKLHEARHSGGYVPDLRQLPYTKTPQLGRAQSPVRQVIMQRMGSSLFSRRVPVDVAAGRR
ncbi:hypothetical protein HaLaN_28683 [Haematococcus lacustris]|uniref:Uncharacterized protein n=1 Tax=Haematococcus lacustris TaxID=44745 RepID=A0A6A0ABD5_HAELA|nr:hypothetical protein HaLaN_28683 [Haematococcus lacustris]